VTEAKRRKRRLKSVTPFDVVVYTGLTLIGLVMVLPFYYTVVVSLSDQITAISSPNMLIPRVIDFQNYREILQYSTLIASLRNSLFIVVFGVLYNMFLTAITAYGFSKTSFPGKKLIMNLMLLTMYFGGGLIPFYLVVTKLGLQNSLAVMIIPTGFSIFYMLVMKSYFQSIPKELMESARIDGAGEFRVLLQIVLPLSLPILATLSLYYAVDRWNDWFNAMIFISKKDLYPIQLALRDIIGNAQGVKTPPPGINMKPRYAEGIKMASVVFCMLPILVLYPFLQKYFVRGLLVGAVKE